MFRVYMYEDGQCIVNLTYDNKTKVFRLVDALKESVVKSPTSTSFIEVQGYNPEDNEYWRWSTNSNRWINARAEAGPAAGPRAPGVKNR